MENGYQRSINVILYLALLLTMLVGCSKTSETGEATKETNPQNYVLASSTALPEEVTNVTRLVIHNDMAYICARVNSDEGISSCISTIGLEGSAYEQCTEYLDISYDLRDFVIDVTDNIWAVCAINSETTSLLQFSDSGTLLQSIDLTSVLGDDIIMSSDTSLFISLDASGNIYVTVKYDKTYVYVFDNQGQYLFSLKDSLKTLCAITTAEGNVAICASDGTTSCSLLTIDVETQDWSENRFEIGTAYGIYSSSSYSFYIFDSSNFCGYNTETRSKEVIFNWSDLGLSTGDAHVCEMSDGRIAALTGTFSQTGLYSYELTILEPGEDNRTILTMSSIQPDDSVLEAVAQFNKTSLEYRIELTQYFFSYDNVSDEDFDNAIEKFNLDIISGNIPDIIDLSNMPVEIYFEKGILEDLYLYINADKDINMEDYFENIFEAFSIDGSLPYITNGVMVETFFADSRVTGTESGWTNDDVLSLLEQYDLDGLTSEFFLVKAIQSSDSFINWSTGESYFDSTEFIQLLELAAKVENNSSSTYSGLTDNDSIAAVYNTTLSVYEIAQYNNLFQGNLNTIGLPNAQGTAYYAVSVSTKIGMSATGENKDGAWDFVRSFLEEKQQDSSYYFPIRKASFEKVMQAAINGNSIWSWLYEGDISRKDVDIAESLLSTAYYSVSDNTTLIEIVSEEAATYFSGSRTAEEVAANIQDRVQTYINEQS